MRRLVPARHAEDRAAARMKDVANVQVVWYSLGEGSTGGCSGTNGGCSSRGTVVVMVAAPATSRWKAVLVHEVIHLRSGSNAVAESRMPED